MPTYVPKSVHWTTVFTNKLNDDVKLVGSTINCGGAYKISEMQPHVQSYAVAMDKARLLDCVWHLGQPVSAGDAACVR